MTTNPSSGKEKDLNQGALDYNSGARTTLPCYVLARVTGSAKKEELGREREKRGKKERNKEQRTKIEIEIESINSLRNTTAELQEPFNQM